MESASSATFLLRRTILLNLLIVSPALTLGYVVNILEFSQSLSRGAQLRNLTLHEAIITSLPREPALELPVQSNNTQVCVAKQYS